MCFLAQAKQTMYYWNWKLTKLLKTKFNELLVFEPDFRFLQYEFLPLDRSSEPVINSMCNPCLNLGAAKLFRLTVFLSILPG
jgi:hypothetical protein